MISSDTENTTTELVPLPAPTPAPNSSKSGSTAADSAVDDFMAYTRVNSHSLSATGKKNGVVALTETLTVSADGGTLTLIYSIQTGASQVARGIAVFEKEAPKPS